MSFFRYPGGKNKLRDRIIKDLQKKADMSKIQYREPFFGGGSIGMRLLLESVSPKKIWVNDKDIGIACLWTALMRYPHDLKGRVLDFAPDVTDFYNFKVELSSLEKMPKQRKKIVDIGFKKLAIHQISYSGLGTKSGGPLGGVSQKSAYKIDCRWSPLYICKKIDKISHNLSFIEIHESGCTNYDFVELIQNDDMESLLYLDPPYYVKGNELYQCGFTEEDHVRLAEALRLTKHHWILSYDDCPEIRKMYGWANIREIYVNYSITALKDKDTGERVATQKKELLISSTKQNEVGSFSWI